SIAMMMTIALRFIPTLIDEVDKIMSAQKARGADIDTGSIIKRAKALIPIFIPLFINSFRRAYELAFAMECRCYRGGEGRTRLKIMKLAFRDYLSMFLMIALIAGIIVSNIYIPAII
ncbi:MAG: energy-coupling factor transporter transmembrane component T, partial [Oscillospiraceae bacterium]